MRRLRFSLSGLQVGLSVVVVAASFGCAPSDGPALNVHTLSTPLEGPCPTGESGGEFASEISSLVATIKGPGIDEPLRGDGTTSITIEGVPAGLDRVVALFGMTGTNPSWRGVSAPVETKAGVQTPVDVLMAKVANLSCARSDSREKRAFHTATLLDDGSVLIVGGAKEFRDASATCAGCKSADATTSAVLYSPQTGVFTNLPPLTNARMFHTATKLADGRVVIAGGTRSATFHTPRLDLTFPFPIAPTAPVQAIEVYDPAQQAFVAAGNDPNGARVFAAATNLLTGEAIITGGIPAAGSPVNDLGNALSTTTICGGEPVQCQNGPPMSSRRAGHHAFTFDPEGVFVWGGSVDIDNNGFQIEQLTLGEATFHLLSACNVTNERNVFFGAGAHYSNRRFLSAGGLSRKADGSFHAIVDGDQQGSAVFAYDLKISRNGCDSGLSSGPTEGPRMNLTGQRFLASAAGLPDKASAFIAGGFEIPTDFNDVDFTPVNAVELFIEDGMKIDDLKLGGVVPTLRDPRGGATTTALGDGTVVIVGGAGDTGALETAEVFADKNTPPQAAGFSP